MKGAILIKIWLKKRIFKIKFVKIIKLNYPHLEYLLFIKVFQ
jgi:hypothetical protein